ncbi:hypothetical protein Dimus_034669, partial [Dionaea muscipula]
ETAESSGDLESTKSEFRQVVGAKPSCKTAESDLRPNFIEFSSEGLMCPYRFEEISFKFVMIDSVKQLVQGFDLISLGGITPFISSLPSHLGCIRCSHWCMRGLCSLLGVWVLSILPTTLLGYGCCGFLQVLDKFVGGLSV